MSHMDYLQNIGARFHGVTLDFRWSGTGWPAPWRVRVVNTKNERDNYRVECFGDTAEKAIESLRAVLAQIDDASGPAACVDGTHAGPYPAQHHATTQEPSHE
jgi:hypothetical protein